MILPCNCSHNSQDELYGKGNRVYNKCKSTSSGMDKYRCTVCGKTQDVTTKREESTKR